MTVKNFWQMFHPNFTSNFVKPYLKGYFPMKILLFLRKFNKPVAEQMKIKISNKKRFSKKLVQSL